MSIGHRGGTTQPYCSGGVSVHALESLPPTSKRPPSWEALQPRLGAAPSSGTRGRPCTRIPPEAWGGALGRRWCDFPRGLNGVSTYKSATLSFFPFGGNKCDSGFISRSSSRSSVCKSLYIMLKTPGLCECLLLPSKAWRSARFQHSASLQMQFECAAYGQKHDRGRGLLFWPVLSWG